VTLTTILPTLRASLPDPADPSSWPAHTSVTTDDVVVAGVSMLRLAELAGTPCVHTADQAPPRHRPRGWTPHEMSVAVVTVVRVRRPRTGAVLLELDATLPPGAVLDQVRLIGRISTAPAMPAHVVQRADRTPGGPFRRLPAPLPSDVRGGDVLCFPCVTALRHRDVVEPVRTALD
jgi:hypothetical protein